MSSNMQDNGIRVALFLTWTSNLSFPWYCNSDSGIVLPFERLYTFFCLWLGILNFTCLIFLWVCTDKSVHGAISTPVKFTPLLVIRKVVIHFSCQCWIGGRMSYGIKQPLTWIELQLTYLVNLHQYHLLWLRLISVCSISLQECCFITISSSH